MSDKSLFSSIARDWKRSADLRFTVAGGLAVLAYWYLCKGALRQEELPDGSVCISRPFWASAVTFSLCIWACFVGRQHPHADDSGFVGQNHSRLLGYLALTGIVGVLEIGFQSIVVNQREYRETSWIIGRFLGGDEFQFADLSGIEMAFDSRGRSFVQLRYRDPHKKGDREIRLSDAVEMALPTVLDIADEQGIHTGGF